MAQGIDLNWILAIVVVLLFSLSLHESAHAWAADLLGDSTAREQGRLTLNPISHIDPIGTILFPLVGILAGGYVFGWAKPVPVQGRNFQNPRKGHLLVAAAGPASNVAAAFLFMLSLSLIDFAVAAGLPPVVSEPLALVCRLGVFLNVILAVFNLIPIPPLDGSWILEGLLPARFGPVFESLRPFSFMILLVLLYVGAIDKVLGPVLIFVRQWI